MALRYHGGQVPLVYSSIPPSTTLETPQSPISLTASSRTHSALDELLSNPSSLETDYPVVYPDPHIAGGRTTRKDTSEASHELAESWVADAVAGDEQMKQAKTKATIGLLSSLIAYVSLNSLAHAIRPDLFIWQDEDREERHWISTSRSWLDRKACRWLSLCGTTHFRKAGVTFGRHPKQQSQAFIEEDDNDWDWQDAWNEGSEDHTAWSPGEQVSREIPGYVFKYAPLVHLFSGEQFWPCDIAEHLYHITPKLNYTSVQPVWQHPKLTDLDGLNKWERGRHVYLTSNDNVEDRPAWLEGAKNIPTTIPRAPDGDGDGIRPEEVSDVGSEGSKGDQNDWMDAGQGSGKVKDTNGKGKGKVYRVHDELRKPRSSVKEQLVGGRSDAPAVLIVVDKGHGVVDAFWFYFYSFNLGNTVLNVRFGNHVGDWEHSMIRFKHGKPKAVFFSEHNFGSAYHYDAVEKIGVRPVVYSAVGTHANYATPGLHPYVLPLGILHDETDQGPLWDPALNSHSYTYDYIRDELKSSNHTPKAPTEWFYFNGHWGDKFYPLGDRRQYRFAGQYHYVNGPLGPRFKNLGRRKMCQGSVVDPCPVASFRAGISLPKRWEGPSVDDDMTKEDMQLLLRNTSGKDVD